MWFEAKQKWIMTLATADKITFYSSPNLKDWIKESDFGKELGAHGGVWKCPDLITIDDNGKPQWVLIVNINPGAINGGSGTQYFIGNFDGHTFTTAQTGTRWLDYGPDNYAGVTWSNTGKRKILLGWMSNWLYANQVPTETWRNAMTLPRELNIKHVDKNIFVTSQPIIELSKSELKPIIINNIILNKTLDIASKVGKIAMPCKINLSTNATADFSFVVNNQVGDTLLIGFDKKQNQFYIDRTKAGKADFKKEFAARHFAPRLTTSNKINLTLIFDVSSVELFADDGLSVMTSINFPAKPYDQIKLNYGKNIKIESLKYSNLKSIRH